VVLADPMPMHQKLMAWFILNPLIALQKDIALAI
jgi:hypothetical protein